MHRAASLQGAPALSTTAEATGLSFTKGISQKLHVVCVVHFGEAGATVL